MALADIVEHHGDRFGDRAAVGYEDTVVSYGELRERARIAAGGLRAAGIGRGDVVAVLLHNSLEFVDLMLGASYLAAIFMPLNWRLAPPELAYIVGHAGAKLLVTEPELEELVAAVRQDMPQTRIAAAADLTSAMAPVDCIARGDADEVLRLMYTSGTTARPKGVVITNGNLDAKCLAQLVELQITAADRALIAGPLYHVGALDLSFTTILYSGGYQLVLRRFDAPAVLDAIESKGLTTVWLAPAMVNAIMGDASVDTRDLSSMRVIINGGEKMPLPLIDRVLDVFPNAWFADAYGLTETVGGDTFLDKGKERQKLGSVGKPVFNAEVRVVDSAGAPVSPGDSGEIVLRGPKVCAGYWRDPEATAHAMRDGWFHTGDVGTLDEDGYLYIIDRLKDIIISGGENVASLEVERVLYEHPTVLEAAVVGRPDDRWGEVPVAYIAPRGEMTPSEEDLIAFCRTRLARYKVPRSVRIVQALPRNPSGKVLKRELRDLEAQGAKGVEIG